MSAPRPASAVELIEVSIGYDRDAPVLVGLDAAVPETGVTRWGGPNGVGKSTLVEVVSGHLPALAGTVRVLGRPADDAALRRERRIVRTRPALYPFMTVRDHLAVACRARGAERGVEEERAMRLGLGPWLDELASTLSSGTAKKLWHVVSTVGDARLVVLDEPFNAVDTDGVEVMVEEILGWARSRAVLLVCHTLPAGLTVDHEWTLR